MLLGGNGQGKTSVLEAIYYLVIFRSFRGSRDRELVRFGEDGFFLAGSGGGDVDAHRVTAGFESTGARKKVTVDGTEAPKLTDAVGRIRAVVFSPNDRGVAAGGPGVRRRFLDVMLSLAVRGYVKHLSSMRAALRQRNAALKQGNIDEAEAFDGALAAHVARVWRDRSDWVLSWRDRYVELCRELGETGIPEIEYVPRALPHEDLEARYMEILRQNRDRDWRRGTTTAGAHRHDLRLAIGGRELRTYGSAGQQRTAAVALRLVEAQTLSAAWGEAPIALYDDVFAELDQNRQARLLKLINRTLPGQAIIAAPRESEVPPALLDRPRWQIEGGRVAQA